MEQGSCALETVLDASSPVMHLFDTMLAHASAKQADHQNPRVMRHGFSRVMMNHGSGGGGAIGQGASSCDNSRGGSPTSGYDNNDKEYSNNNTVALSALEEAISIMNSACRSGSSQNITNFDTTKDEMLTEVVRLNSLSLLVEFQNYSFHD